MHDTQFQSLMLQILQDPAGLPDQALAALSTADWHRIQAMARRQRITAFLYFRLRQSPQMAAVPAEVLEALAAAYQERTMRNLFLFSELRELAQALHDVGIPLLVLKGMHLATTVYEEVGLREMDDIDVLVPRAHLQQVANVMQDLGYVSKEPIDVPRWSANEHHLPRMFSPHNTVVEVHWNITWPRDQYSLSDLDGLWDRACPLTIAQVEVSCLSSEDLLLHLCVHAAYQHMFYTGLRPICDITAMVQAHQNELDWSRVITQARQWQWAPGVHLMLRLARECLGADITDEVLIATEAAHSEEAFQAALFMLWNIESDVSALPRNLARMWHRTSRIQQVLDILRALVPIPTRVAKTYGLPASSARVWWYYPRYMYDLIHRQYQAWRQLRESDPEVRHMALSKSVLMDWLYDES